MSHPSGLSGAMQLPFSEQIAFFRRKLGNLVPTRAWDDMLGAAHDDGFMVAGAMDADLLTDLAAAVDKAIAEGRGIEEFRRDFRATVARNGWTGWTGEGSVQGEAWRVRTILRTNAYTSYAAGRFAQLQTEGYAFWVYRHGDSREPRVQHLSWNGLVLSPDHEFWATHYPPSDWGCSCYVTGASSEAMARRLGGQPGKKLPDGWQKIDLKTGAPVGIGKGWGYAPGASVAPLISAMAAKIGSWDYRIAKAFMDSLPAERADALSMAYRELPSTADDARRYSGRIAAGNADGAGDLAPLPKVRTLGLVPVAQAERITGLTDIDLAGYDFTIDRSGVGHVFREHGNDAVQQGQGQRGITPADFARLPEILSGPDAVTLAGTSEIGETIVQYTRRIGGETYVVRMAVRGAKRRTLALKTMFVKVGK